MNSTPGAEPGRGGPRRGSWLLVALVAILIAVELVHISQSNRLAARLAVDDEVLANHIARKLEQSPVLAQRLAERFGPATVDSLGRDESFLQRLAMKVAEGVSARLGTSADEAAGGLEDRLRRAAAELASAVEPERTIGRHGGTLRIPIKRNPDSFNYVSARSLVSFGIGMHIFEPLFFRSVWTERSIPVLADRFEVSADQKVFTVFLRRDVNWSDGERFDADDVIFTFEAIAHPSVVSYSKNDFEYEMPDGSIQRVRMEKVDDFAVRFYQPLPYVAFLAKLYHPIIPEHRLRPALERGEFSSTWSLGTDPSEVVGTGPFQLESCRPGEEVVLARNQGYWRRDHTGQALPYLERVRFRVFEKEDTAQVAFLGGELDVLPPEFITGEVYSALKREAGARGFRLLDLGQSVGFAYLVFNQNLKRNPRSGAAYLPEHLLGWFREARFRRAVAHAIDRDAIVSSCYDSLAAPVHSVYNRACGKYHNGALPFHPYDLDRARALLDELDLKDRDGDGVREDAAGHKVRFTITWYRRSEAIECLVRIVRERLGRIGIQALSNRVGDREYEEKLFSTYEWELLIGQESGGAGDPMGADRLWSSREDYHMWFPRQEEPSTDWERELDGIFLLASTEPEELRRLELLYRFQEIVAREVPLIPIAIDKSFAAVDARVENFLPRVIEPTSIYNLFEIWKRPE